MLEDFSSNGKGKRTETYTFLFLELKTLNVFDIEYGCALRECCTGLHEIAMVMRVAMYKITPRTLPLLRHCSVVCSLNIQLKSLINAGNCIPPEVLFRVSKASAIKSPLDIRKVDSSSYQALGACFDPYKAFLRESAIASLMFFGSTILTVSATYIFQDLWQAVVLFELAWMDFHEFVLMDDLWSIGTRPEETIFNRHLLSLWLRGLNCCDQDNHFLDFIKLDMNGTQISSVIFPISREDMMMIVLSIACWLQTLLQPKMIMGSLEAESINFEQASTRYGSVFRQRRSVQSGSRSGV
ncbi:hypothetical protein Tco_1531397 [Tanacetum coccineum]